MKDMQFTSETQINWISPENKTINTQYGEKQTFSIKDTGGNYYTVWDVTTKPELQGYLQNATKVIIGYTAKTYQAKDGSTKESRSAKMVNALDGQKTPQNAPQQASGDVMDKDTQIARSVALKASVDLICNGKVEYVQMYEVAESMVAWLKGEEVKKESVENDLDPSDIPF